MKELIGYLKGDKVIWSFVALLALFSFMPVFSASSNLAYIGHGTGNTLGYLMKHLFHVLLGFGIIFIVHKKPFRLYSGLSVFLLPVSWLMLLYTLASGVQIGGANASRWLRIPVVNISFQPSTIAFVILMIYVSRYLSRNSDGKTSFKDSFIQLWLPVAVTLGLILPANFSTTALIFSMVLMLTFVANYPIKYLAIIIGLGVTFLLFFVLLSKAFPDNRFFNRVDTWTSRIENFSTEKPDEDDYQIEKAKTAIASGGLYGLGPGKSVQKNFLPQSSSDFIFAIIVEEYGLLGGIAVMTIYLLLFFRFVIAAHASSSLFGKFVVIGLGFPMIFQALINMCVAVELMPVTGQTLPLISSGGSSIWMTCVALGIIISVTKKDEEIELEQEEALNREEVLQRLIDQQIAAENEVEEDYSIQERGVNPMSAVKNKY
jgi:cell division protein FtsW